MEYEKAARLGALLAKDYAEDLFKLLVNYQNISASEAASRLSLHIRTAQDFLDKDPVHSISVSYQYDLSIHLRSE